MSLTMDQTAYEAIQTDSDKAAGRQRLFFLGVMAVILAYLAFSWVQFDIGSLKKKWKPERAALFVLDTYAHKNHVTTRWASPDEVVIAFEGGHRHVYDPKPDWYADNGADGRVVTFGNGGKETHISPQTCGWSNRCALRISEELRRGLSHTG